MGDLSYKKRDIESQQRKADEHSTISTTDVSQEEQWNDDSAMVQSNNSITKMQPKDVICPICHEQFEYGDTLATSRNNDCCHTAFHSDCFISWLMTDHKDCPICRSIFIVDNPEEDEDEVPA
ncbi:predicted protein [Chaetoceros tenuissimus]|uniref:RING-type domain-containing protein n=1 Tax=Chaetoceros tenuissimus TaxID=426638 RepID=A0AAD3D4E4_9STRA|nr:predicted protein [Chaetoceros tenuissimus]